MESVSDLGEPEVLVRASAVETRGWEYEGRIVSRLAVESCHISSYLGTEYYAAIDFHMSQPRRVFHDDLGPVPRQDMRAERSTPSRGYLVYIVTNRTAISQLLSPFCRPALSRPLLRQLSEEPSSCRALHFWFRKS